jgi:8-oxo-dGTP diphosphatase
VARRLAAQTDGVDAIADEVRGPVRAAGGLVVRDEKVLLVHRPRFDDWSLPKGKLKRREHPMAGAVREVREESGVLGVPGVRLPSARYDVWSGDALVAKLVDYWAMSVGEIDAFTPGDEVDNVAWLALNEAQKLLSYPRDVHVLTAYRELPPLRPPVVLLRPVSADPPVDGDAPGADSIGTLLGLMRPGRLISTDDGPSRRTLAPLAQARGIEIELDERFGDDSDPERAATLLGELVATGATTVVCGQTGLFSALPVLGAARSLSQEAREVHGVGPGDGLVLSFAGDTLVAADPFSPALE